MSRQPRRHALVAIVWYIAAIPALLSFGYARSAGGDLWWHLANGRWIVEHKSLPLSDSWSFTRYGQPWLQHEWLSDLLYQLVAMFCGQDSLVYLKWLVLLGAFLLLFDAIWRISGEPISSYLGVMLAAAVAAPFLDIRPQLFSILGYAALLWLMLPPRRAPVWLPLIFLAWVNMHAGFFFGLIALSLLVLPSILSGSAVDRRRNLLIWCASVLICLCNPNGFRAFAYPLKYAFDRASPFQAIGEWQPPFRPEGIHSPIYPYAIGIFICASVFVLLKNHGRNRAVSWIGIALGVLTLAMSLTSRRFISLFAISQSLVTGPALAILLRQTIDKVPWLVPPALAALLGITLLRPYPLAPYAFWYLTAKDEFPIESCNFIETNSLSGNVFSYYNWGGYLHLRTNGGMRVFIDGRADTVYDAETLLRYAVVQGFRPSWQEVLENSGADYILWPRDNRGKPLAELVTSGRWRMLYGDSVSVLLVRTDRMPSSPLKPTPVSAQRRLALGVEYFEQRRYDLAEQNFQAALQETPYLRSALIGLARAQSLQGKRDEALQTVARAERFFPGTGRAAEIK